MNNYDKQDEVARLVAAELPICHLLARTLRMRCVIVQCGSVVCTIAAGDVMSGMLELYATI